MIHDMPDDAPPRRPAVNSWFRQPADVRLPAVMDMMRDLSRQTEPGDAVKVYGSHVGKILDADSRVSLSRRGMERPKVMVTQSPVFGRAIDPWLERDALPMIEGGILADLIWGDEPVVINDLRIDPSDPSAPHLDGMRSLAAIPLFDGGEALNMVIICRRDANAFTNDFLPEHVWLSNLFGRATANLVLRKELERTYARLEQELQVVADIQRSLLPKTLPSRPGLDVAAFYQTSQHAGGDYYDFFELPSGELGLLVADVSGHGTPAAVMMAVTHAVAHTRPGRPHPPSAVLSFVNRALCERYTGGTGTFVTAFFAIYNPATRELTYSSAGHNPPRLKRGNGGPNGVIDAAPALPLGIDADEPYTDATQRLCPGDTLVLYTDGITEARDPTNELFGTDRLDAVLAGCNDSAQTLVDCTVAAVEAFTQSGPVQDDRTLVVMRV